MIKKIISTLIAFTLLPSLIFAKAPDKDIVVFYENDVHCNVDGYAKLAALKADEKQNTDYVSIISAGDFIQGKSLGSVSRGEYIIKIMNQVGYDVVTLGNHEFDYSIPRLKELTDMLSAKTVSCNFFDLTTNKTVYEPYTIISYGDTDIAYIGISTPETITKSTPAFFRNDKGEYVYSFSPQSLSTQVQNAVDSAKKDGADYIFAISHLGSEDVTEEWSIQTVISKTEGIDVVFDGHSHSIVENIALKDKAGNNVIMTSTGTAFENIGKLTLSSDGNVKTELIKTETYEKTEEKTNAVIEEIKSEYDIIGKQVVGKSDVLLTTLDQNGMRATRNSETNIGDLCADAMRYVLDADIGFSNGGGIRSDIEVGDVTFNTLLSVFPFNNTVCSIEVTGQQIMDALELSASKIPEESGGFLQVSGIKYDIDASVKSGVELTEEGMFKAVNGERRVKNIMIENRETKEYEPLNADKLYSIASTKYVLTECGDGYSMFEDSVIIKDELMPDTDVLKIYISEHLNGTIPQYYKEPQNRINIINNDIPYIPLRKTFEEMGCNVVWNKSEPTKIYIHSGDITVIFTSGTNIIEFDNKAFKASKDAYIEDGVTYISSDCIPIYNYIIN